MVERGLFELYLHPRVRAAHSRDKTSRQMRCGVFEMPRGAPRLENALGRFCGLLIHLLSRLWVKNRVTAAIITLRRMYFCRQR